MYLAGVPDQLEWSAVVKLIEALGLPTEQITQQGVKISYTSIECEIYATDADGSRYVDPKTNGAAIHRIHIPLVHRRGD